MIRRRATPDGLPFRVYERFGVRVYSIGFKQKSGKWAFRYECPVANKPEIAKLRRQAIIDAATVQEDRPVGGFSALVDAWFTWQEALPDSSADKRAKTTLAENRREAANLKTAWGHLPPSGITKTMGYDYLEACVTAKRPEKGNKEMALAHLILEWGVRKNVLEANPLTKLRKNKILRDRRLVEAHEMALAVEMGRKHGGARLIVALALKTAWLCVRRSVEVRAIMRQSITDEGLLWTDGKDKKKAKVLIEWSPELRDTINEALSVQRFGSVETMYLFGNMSGKRYTKGGWKAMLVDLMTACEEEAARRRIDFRKFSLQDCRPMGVSDKMERGDKDTQDATGHTDGKMIATVYDRRRQKRAKPAA